jgi:hypothetical protein
MYFLYHCAGGFAVPPLEGATEAKEEVRALRAICKFQTSRALAGRQVLCKFRRNSK